MLSSISSMERLVPQSTRPLPAPSTAEKSPGAVQARAASLVMASSSFVAIGGISKAAKPQV